MWRIRPVPVVFLLLAFMPHLSVGGKKGGLVGKFTCVGWLDGGGNLVQGISV